ncbi:MAG: DUF262 domain-containing protein [Sporomusaceae bacterium]|nr:DUF262 domain-containing protein [Sporomusaceae bacterium]
MTNVTVLPFVNNAEEVANIIASAEVINIEAEKIEAEHIEAEETTSEYLEEVNEPVTAMAHKRAMDRNTKALTVRKIKEYSDKNKLNFNLAIQRGEVWKPFQKSLLINSLAVNFPIPPVFAWDKERNGNLIILDGKQRLTTIIDFLNDGFRLEKNTPDALGYKMEGKTFSELDNELQNEILAYTIDFQVCMDNNPDIITDIFVRLNNGTSLTKFEKLRAEIGTTVMDFVDKVAKMPFWDSQASWTPLERTHFVAHQVILATMMVLDGEIELSIDNIGSYAFHLRDKGIDEHIANKLIEITQYLGEISINEKDAKKIYRTTHIPAIFTVVNTKIDKLRFTDDLLNWFKNRGSAYQNASRSGVSKSANVQIRLKEISAYFAQYDYPTESI